MNSQSNIIDVGFIGVGSIAIDHARAIQALGHNIIAGSAISESSPRWKKFKEIAPKAVFFSNIDDLLIANNVDAIIVCLPWYITESILKKLLLCSKKILIEKPISLSSVLLEKTLKLPNIQISNKTIGFNRRFYSSVQALKQRVSKGGIKSIEISISESVQRLEKTFGASIVPNILVYNSCHILDTAHYLLGELTILNKFCLQKKINPMKFNSSFNFLKTENGHPVSLLITDENPLPVGIRILFDDETTWHLSPMEELNVFKGYDIIEPNDVSHIRRYVPKKISSVSVDTNLKPGFYGQMESFLNGNKYNISSSLNQHLGLLKFIESLSY